jgi:hypothetical protein
MTRIQPESTTRFKVFWSDELIPVDDRSTDA